MARAPEPLDLAELLQANDPVTLEIRGAVYEAMGDDRRAAETYAQRLEGQVKSLAPNAHPDLFAWLREWWIGRAYARCMVRTGQAESTITALQQDLDRAAVDCVPTARRCGSIACAWASCSTPRASATGPRHNGPPWGPGRRSRPPPCRSPPLPRLLSRKPRCRSCTKRGGNPTITLWEPAPSGDHRDPERPDGFSR